MRIEIIHLSVFLSNFGYMLPMIDTFVYCDLALRPLISIAWSSHNGQLNKTYSILIALNPLSSMTLTSTVMANMSAKLDEDSCNGLVSLTLIRSKHDRQTQKAYMRDRWNYRRITISHRIDFNETWHEAILPSSKLPFRTLLSTNMATFGSYWFMNLTLPFQKCYIM